MATVLSDWQSIVVDPIRVPRNPSRQFSLEPFDTEGRRGHAEAALLIYMVRGLQGSAHVVINNTRAGTITRASDPSTYRMQLMIFNENTLWGIGGPRNKITLTDISDEFDIINMTCFYHRETDSSGLTVLADFAMIAGDSPVPVFKQQGIERFTLAGSAHDDAVYPPFDTGGVVPVTDAPAILIFSIRLGATESAVVFVNETRVGTITGSPSGEFRTQFITFTALALNGDRGKNNTLKLGHVTAAFEIKDVVCFFRQAT